MDVYKNIILKNVNFYLTILMKNFKNLDVLDYIVGGIKDYWFIF